MAITDCDKIITLRELDNLIGDYIQNSNGQTLRVNYNGKDPSYCPPYSELTNGTYIQKYNQVTNNPTNDTDGITVNGSYANNQCVRRGDVKVIYTRYSGLTINANPDTLNITGGIVTLSHTLKYNRCERTYKSDCSSYTARTISTPTDTVASISWVQSPNIGTIENNTLTVSGVTEACNKNLSAKVRFRGSDKESNTCTIHLTGTSCACSSVTLDKTSLEWEAESTSQQTVIIDGSCLTTYTVHMANGNYFTATYHGNVITIKPKGQNTTKSPYTDTAIVNYALSNGVTSCQSTITVTQNAADCTCDDFAITSDVSNIHLSSEESSTKEINYSAGTCILISTLSASTDWLTAAPKTNPDRIELKTLTRNTGESRSAKLIVNYNKNDHSCSSSITISNIIQDGVCGCANVISISPTSCEFNATDTSAVVSSVTISTAGCYSSTTSIESGWTGDDKFTATVNSDKTKVTISPKAANDTYSAYTATLTLTIKYNLTEGTPSEGCSDTKTITITQNGKDCDCDALTIDE